MPRRSISCSPSCACRPSRPPGSPLAERADKEGWPAARLLAALAEQEIAERTRRRFEPHLAEAKLPPGKTLANFDFNVLPMVSKAHVTALVAADRWLDQGANLILIDFSSCLTLYMLSRYFAFIILRLCPRRTADGREGGGGAREPIDAERHRSGNPGARWRATHRSDLSRSMPPPETRSAPRAMPRVGDRAVGGLQVGPCTVWSRP